MAPNGTSVPLLLLPLPPCSLSQPGLRDPLRPPRVRGWLLREPGLVSLFNSSRKKPNQNNTDFQLAALCLCVCLFVFIVIFSH